MKHGITTLALTFGLLFPVPLLRAQTGVVTWTNPASGLWHGPQNWSPRAPATNDNFVFITNAVTKTVRLDAATPETNRLVKTFNLSAPAGATNTLFLSGTNALDRLLTAQNDFLIGNGGALIISNAQLQVLEKSNGMFRVASASVVITNGALDLVFDVPGRIGEGGNGSLTLSGGALNAATNFSVGYGNGNHGTLSLMSGTIDVQGQLRVGENAGSHGELIVTGGNLRATNSALSAAARIGNSGFGQLTVSNGLVNFDDTSVGRNNGATGIVHVAGGTLASSALSLGRFAGAFGRALVTGGQLSLPGSALWVGREGTGELIVSNGTVTSKSLHVGASPDGVLVPQGNAILAGGSVVISSNVLIGTPLLSSGALTVDGGTLKVQPNAGPGEIRMQRGTLTLNGGLVQTTIVNLTNSEGQILLNGGTLRARDLTAANGSPFVVGDGVHPAVLQMDGGTFSFADGLIINPNATLIVCGELLGTITQFGNLITNCLPRILRITRTGTTAAIDFLAVAGLNYLLEYKSSLEPGTWTPIPPAVPGSFGTVTATDPAATDAARFYRIHVQ